MTKRRHCAYCGTTADLTKDHIPPKSLFAPPLPKNLISVYACRKCHRRTTKDDEYFRQCVCLHYGAGDHPEAQKNWEKILRSFQNPKAPGLRRRFFASLKEVWLQSQGGIHLGKSATFDVDLRRIFRVVERTVRGLYLHETGNRMPNDYEVRVYSDDTLRRRPPETTKWLEERILSLLMNAPQKVIGQDVFSYRFQLVPENLLLSAWGLVFYRSFSFLVITTPKSMARTEDPEQQPE